MLVKDILQLCDRNMNICIDMSNNTTDYVVNNYLQDNRIDFKAHDLLDAFNNGIDIVKQDDLSEKAKILEEALWTARFSQVDNLNLFLQRYGKIEHFGNLEVDYFGQNNQGQFVIHTKEI